MRTPFNFILAITAAMVVIQSGVSARAETLSLSLSQSTSIESATAVLNSKLGVVHPPLQVQDWDAGGGQQTTLLELGVGSHGAFNSTNYLRFHDGVYNNDGIVIINTDTYPSLDVTEFVLEAGWTLRPVGSKPLVIRSLSKVEIRGVINCSGGKGEDLNSVTTQSPSGGLGRCGGADGGNGGAVSITPAQGSAPATNAAAGGSAGAHMGGGGGGGAGMDTSAPAPGPGLQLDDLTPSGAAGGAGSDISFNLIGGGGGGGGGALYDDINDPVTVHASGGGGGAGGGSIYIRAIGDVVIEFGASVLARGGDGGGSTGTGWGGGGGGGAGGSVQIFSGGDITIDGVIDAMGGTGGLSDGGNGGNGGAGRTWVSDSDTNPSGGGTVDPMWIIPILGVVNYQTGIFEMTSALVDTRATRPDIRSLTLDAAVSAPSTVDLEIAASEQSFEASDAQWFPAAMASSLSGKRYVRFRVRIDNQDNAQPALVRSLSLEFGVANHEKFEFASCQLVTPHSGSTPPWAALFVILAPLALWTRLRLAHRVSADKPVSGR